MDDILPVILGLGFAVLLFAAPIWLYRKAQANAAREKEKKQNQLRVEAQEFMREVRASCGLRRISSTVILKPGEVAYFEEPASLYETRAVRHYASSGGRVRIMKGLSVGGSSGNSYSTQEWTRIAHGLLTITNKRLIFAAQSTSRSFPIARILSADCSTDGVEIPVEGRQKGMVFKGGMNPLILASVVRICCAFEDPSKIDPQKIEITYV